MSTPSSGQTEAQRAVTSFTLPGWDRRLRGFHCGDEVDTFALITQRFLIFVDTSATPEDATAIVARLGADLAGRQPLVILTHADYDHCWGSAVFTQGNACPAPIIGHALTRERLLSQGAADELAQRLSEQPRFASVRLIAPDIAYTERMVIDGGDLTLELLHTPGHTPDHTVIWIPEQRLLLAGDAVERPWPYVHTAADLPIMRATLARLAALGAERIAVCHGGKSDPMLIAANIAYFDTVERQCRQALTHTPALATQAATPDVDGEALEVAVGLPYADALRAFGAAPEQVADFYRPFHQSAIRATIGWLETHA